MTRMLSIAEWFVLVSLVAFVFLWVIPKDLKHDAQMSRCSVHADEVAREVVSRLMREELEYKLHTAALRRSAYVPLESDPSYEFLDMEITYYCSCEKCTGAYTTTATGTIPMEGYTVAVDPEKIKLGSVLWIEGLGWRIAEDTGGAINGKRIDVYVESHEEALSRGRHRARVAIPRQEDKQ